MLSKSSFDSCRVFLCICVFFCHVFEQLNVYGFLFVAPFFFFSGYGLSLKVDRSRILYRLIPYILCYAFFVLLYWIFYPGVYPFAYPSSWFLVAYFLCSLVYRFVPFRALLVPFLIIGLLLPYLGFSYTWVASIGLFFFGVLVARYPPLFSLRLFLFLFPFGYLASFHPIFLNFYCLFPLWLYLRFLPLFFPSSLSSFTFSFYASHVFFLGLFGASWCLGGSPSLFGVLGGFILTCIVVFWYRLFFLRRFSYLFGRR